VSCKQSEKLKIKRDTGLNSGTQNGVLSQCNADVISDTYEDMATGKQQIRRFQRPHSGLKTSQQETPSNIYK